MTNNEGKFDIVEIRLALDAQEPSLPYEYALWCEDVAKGLKQLATDYENKAKRQIDYIVRDRIESAIFEIVSPVEQRQTVDCEKLRREQRKVYDRIVHLKPTDVVALIGEREAYKLASLSEDYSPDMDIVTLQDLKKALKKKADGFITIVYKPQSRKIMPIGTYHDPRELPEEEIL